MKILLSCPTLEIRYEWFTSFMKLWQQVLAIPGNDIVFFPQHRVPVQLAQTRAVRMAIKNNCDYILHIDDDIWDIPDGAVRMMLDADKEFISALMYANAWPYHMCALVKKPEDKNVSLVDIVKENGPYKLLEAPGEEGVVPVDLTAFPFVLWKVSLFKKLPEPWFVYDEGVPTDNYFCQKCLDHGVQPYVHKSLPVTHRGVSYWNRVYKFISEGRYRIATGQLTEKDPFYKVVLEQQHLLAQL